MLIMPPRWSLVAKVLWHDVVMAHVVYTDQRGFISAYIDLRQR